MKTFVKSIAIGLLAGGSFIAEPVLAANYVSVVNGTGFFKPDKGSFSVSVNQVNNTEKVCLHIDKQIGQKLFVSLKSASGEVIYSFGVEKYEKTITRNYDFVGADEGVYTLEVSDGKTKVTKQINLQGTQTVTIAKIAIQ
jgi:hypothetical protein